MKITSKLSILIVLLMMLILPLTITAVHAAQPVERQQAQLMWHPQSGNSGVVEGSHIQLVRNRNGVSFNIQTSSLQPGHVYSVWFVAINAPQNCAVPYACTTTDILTTPDLVEADVVYGTGNIAGGSGRGGFGGHIAAGPLSNSWFGNGLTNPLGAEIHIALNDHGPMIPDIVSNMLHSYRGGCTDESLPPPFPASAKADGIPGPNTCRLYQFNIFVATDGS